eukprot:1194916-Prorocentrum_minimum.AAC.2
MLRRSWGLEGVTHLDLEQLVKAPEHDEVRVNIHRPLVLIQCPHHRLGEHVLAVDVHGVDGVGGGGAGHVPRRRDRNGLAHDQAGLVEHLPYLEGHRGGDHDHVVRGQAGVLAHHVHGGKHRGEVVVAEQDHDVGTLAAVYWPPAARGLQPTGVDQQALGTLRVVPALHARAVMADAGVVGVVVVVEEPVGFPGHG